MASEVSFSRAPLAASGVTSSRAMPMRRSSACMASCGWPEAGACTTRPPSLISPIRSHAASSRSVSSPGSTTAPCGSFAMVASRLAVAGIEPVEPAAITGASFTARRMRSASISRSRRAAGSIAPRSSRIAGHASRAMRRNVSVFCQYSSSSRGTRSSSRSHGTCRVVMSSIRRASVSASASAEAGLLATSGWPLPVRMPGDAIHVRISSASSIRRVSPPSSRGISSPASPLAASANASSSSSMSPSGTMRGSTAAGELQRVKEGIARERAGAPGRQEQRGVRERQRIGGIRKALDQCSIGERADQRRQEICRGRDVEHARARGHGSVIGATWRRLYATLSIMAASAALMAAGVPTCIQVPSSRRPYIRPASIARSNSLFSENLPLRRIGEQRGREDRGARVDERHDLRARRGATSRPSGAIAKSPRPS